MSESKIIYGDCLEVMKTMAANSVDAIVTDPPYGLKFMGSNWDHGIPGTPFWKEALRLARPGAWMLAFGGTRTFHRLTCAIEDTGWEIRDCVMWVYAVGMPKSSTGLKPAWEPIILARKPLEGTVVKNVLKYGTGALNIDECRIEYTNEADKNSATPQGKCTAKAGAFAGKVQHDGIRTEFKRPIQKGRWPSNFMHDGSPEVLALFPESNGQQGDLVGHTKKRVSPNGIFGPMNPASDYIARNDTGSAARFFFCGKASPHERNEGLNNEKNGHPTVKPLALMAYLCRLITPPGGTILDPFCGSGSTGKAALAEGFKFIGIEQDSEYVEIARKRCGLNGSRSLVDIFDEAVKP